MIIPIQIESLEKDISECEKHLDFLKKTSTLSQDMNKFITENKLCDKATFDLDLSNAHCIATISQLEIFIIFKSLFYSKNKREEKQILKNAILLIYESVKSIDNFNLTLKKYSKYNQMFLEEHNIYIEELKKLKKEMKFNSTTKNIRNHAAGHINKDYVIYSKCIDSIEIEKTIDFLTKYKSIMDRLNEYLIRCLSFKIKHNYESKGTIQ